MEYLKLLLLCATHDVLGAEVCKYYGDEIIIYYKGIYKVESKRFKCEPKTNKYVERFLIKR